MRPLKICNIVYRAAYRLMSKPRYSLLIVVYFRQKNRETIKQLGIRLECFLQNRKYGKKRFQYMTAGRNPLQKLEELVMRLSNGYVSITYRCSTSVSFAGTYRVGCVPQCVTTLNNSTTARLALEPNSSSTLEIHVGIRAGGLRWCVAVRIIGGGGILPRKLKSS